MGIREKAAATSAKMLSYVGTNPLGAKVISAVKNLNQALATAQEQGVPRHQLEKTRTAALQGIRLDVLEMSVHRRGELEKAVNAVRDTYTANAARMRGTNELVASEFRDRINAMTDAEITQMAQGVIHGKTSLNPREADILSSALRGVDDGLYGELRKNLNESKYSEPWLKDAGIADAVSELDFMRRADGNTIPVRIDGKLAGFDVESIADFVESASEAGE